MNNIIVLDMSYYKDGWFVLENKDMDPNAFNSLINVLERMFIKEYGVDGAKKHVNKVMQNNQNALFINQIKVPNIIKSLVQDTTRNVQINLKGINKNGEQVAKKITKPFVANECTELIPYYNKTANKTTKR